MSRLFYEGSDASNELPRMQIRIKSKSSGRYLEKIAKLVPSEIIAGYISLIGFVPFVRYEQARPWVYWVIFVMCLILTPIYFSVQANKIKPYKTHVLLSTCAFVIWAYTVSGAAIVPSFYDAAIGSILLISFTLISGAIPLER